MWSAAPSWTSSTFSTQPEPSVGNKRELGRREVLGLADSVLFAPFVGPTPDIRDDADVVVDVVDEPTAKAEGVEGGVENVSLSPAGDFKAIEAADGGILWYRDPSMEKYYRSVSQTRNQ